MRLSIEGGAMRSSCHPTMIKQNATSYPRRLNVRSDCVGVWTRFVWHMVKQSEVREGYSDCHRIGSWQCKLCRSWTRLISETRPSQLNSEQVACVAGYELYWDRAPPSDRFRHPPLCGYQRLAINASHEKVHHLSLY